MGPKIAVGSLCYYPAADYVLGVSVLLPHAYAVFCRALNCLLSGLVLFVLMAMNPLLAMDDKGQQGGALAAGNTTDVPIYLGILAFRGDEVARMMWQPTIDYLNQVIPGHKFSLVPLTLDNLELKVQQKRVDFVITSPANYVTLRARFGVARLATLRNRRLGIPSTEFGAVIFTRADRGDVSTLAHLAGKRLMAVHPNAFSGWWMAWRELIDHDLDPSRDLDALLFSDYPHDSVVHAVLAGEADAGTVRTDLLEDMALAGIIELADIKILNAKKKPDFPFLLSTRLYPEWAFSILKHVPERLGYDVAVALLNIAPNGPVAAAANSAGWTVPRDYRAVDDLMQQLKVGHYSHLGTVTFREVVQQYPFQLALIFAVLICMVYFCLFISRLNTRLRLSQLALREQVKYRQVAQEEAQLHVERLRRLYTISAAVGASLEEEITRLLRDSCDLLEMDVGQVNVFDADKGVITTPYRFSAGAGHALEAGERRIVNSCESVTFAENEAAAWSDLSIAGSLLPSGLDYPSQGAYLSVPLWVRERKFGTLSFYSESPLAAGFMDADKEIVMLVSRWIAVVVERDNAFQEEKVEKLAQATTIARGAFIANMSHEMKTPLAAIVGYAERLLYEVLSPRQAEELILVILQKAQHATQLINDLLDLSSIDHNQFTPLLGEVDLVRVCREVRDICAPQAYEKGLKFELDCVYPLPEVIRADSNLLKKALTHLLNNAVKFTEQGVIRFSVCHDAEHNGVTLEVSDTGIGINSSQFGRIFEPFVQVGEGRDRAYGGTGLGLYLAKHYVESLGGNIQLSSKLGQGSTFTIVLPQVCAADTPMRSGPTFTIVLPQVCAADTPMRSGPTFQARNTDSEPLTGNSAPPAVAKSGGRDAPTPWREGVSLSEADASEAQKSKVPQCRGIVLVAEDNPVNQKIIQRYLVLMGLEVKVVSNGLQAVESCDIVDFDLILMDIQMPVMDGLEAARRINQKVNPPPIIAVTANSLAEDRQIYQEAGCYACISKPINVAHFYDVVSGLFKAA